MLAFYLELSNCIGDDCDVDVMFWSDQLKEYDTKWI